jgi:prepilin-type N-terminal cleavage/methylation domain-containing protein
MDKNKNKSGFSLIEIMVAMLLLGVLVVGGSKVMSATGGDIRVYGNKRVALELARTELEGLMAADYFTLRDAAVAEDPQTGSRSETWNGLAVGINWTNTLVSTGGILDNEYIALDVAVSYIGTDQTVLLHAMKTVSP